MHGRGCPHGARIRAPYQGLQSHRDHSFVRPWSLQRARAAADSDASSLPRSFSNRFRLVASPSFNFNTWQSISTKLFAVIAMFGRAFRYPTIGMPVKLDAILSGEYTLFRYPTIGMPVKLRGRFCTAALRFRYPTIGMPVKLMTAG